MLVIWKVLRVSRIWKDKVKYKSRNSYLIEPIYWIGRDHARMQTKMRHPMLKGIRYIMRGSRERYIDVRGYEKQSILPSWCYQLRWVSERTRNRWRHKYYSFIKPIKRRYNLHIKCSKLYNLTFNKWYSQSSIRSNTTFTTQ